MLLLRGLNSSKFRAMRIYELLHPNFRDLGQADLQEGDGDGRSGKNNSGVKWTEMIGEPPIGDGGERLGPGPCDRPQ